jgi:hypothetical protein
MVRDSQGTARLVVFASLSGKAFLDENQDKRPDGGTERGIEGLKVWLDDESVVETDGNGNYRFDGITPGTHRIRADLSNVPAGLIFADVSERSLAIFPYRLNRQDLPIIRTAQIRGEVRIEDYSVDADEPVLRPFPDARIIASGDRDSFSEADGSFVLGDLPPQRYLLQVDPATIPEGYVAKPSSISKEVRAGETASVSFQLVVPPKPVLQLPGFDDRIELPALPANPAPSPPANPPANGVGGQTLSKKS